jgi:YVTN family beta-propeller protein
MRDAFTADPLAHFPATNRNQHRLRRALVLATSSLALIALGPALLSSAVDNRPVNPSHAVADTIPVGGSPKGIDITPDGRKAFVANRDSDTVSVIDVEGKMATTTIPVNNGPMEVATTPDGRQAYVTNFDAKHSAIIDTASLTVTATVPVGELPYGVTISRDGRRAYISNHDSDTVSVIDTGNNTVIATITRRRSARTHRDHPGWPSDLYGKPR